MTEVGPVRGDETFEVSARPESVNEATDFEGANVCRVAMLSTRFADDPGAIEPLVAEYRSLGFSDRVISAERRWRNQDRLEMFDRLGPAPDDDNARLRVWNELNESGSPQDALRFLVLVLGSPLERESAAAAAVLWRQLDLFRGGRLPRGPRLWGMWDRLFDLDLEPGLLFPDGRWLWPNGDGDQSADVALPLEWDPVQWDEVVRRVSSRFGDPYADPFLVLVLVSWRLRRARRSNDPVTVSLAMAAFEPSGADDDIPIVGRPPSRQAAPGPLVVSTMIHGTWGWKGDWWRPRSPFHEFILQNHRPNLYSRGAKYSWSGALSQKQRIQAAGDFTDWSYDVAPHGLQTVFAHSYGGEIASRAVLCGAAISELVLLSTPVTPWVEFAIPWTPRVVDVRLRFDPVLGIAQTRQRVAHPAPNTTVVLLGRWRYAHSATHDEAVWHDEDIARRGRL